MSIHDIVGDWRSRLAAGRWSWTSLNLVKVIHSNEIIIAKIEIDYDR